jgi:SAM-dependent methyltransferase
MNYNKQIAAVWDSFIGWRRREKTEGVWLCSILNRFAAKSILDVAAGTGFHAIVLAGRGFQVEAWDCSRAMLSAAKRNAAAAGVTIPLRRRAWLSPRRWRNGRTFDAVICLGNSFAHLLKRAYRKRALDRWHSLLNQGGILIVDVRNFDGLLHSIPPTRPFAYQGTGRVDVASVSSLRIDLRYTFGNTPLFSLTYANLCPKQIVDEAQRLGFQHLTTYGDGREQFNAERVGFYQMTFRKCRYKRA